MPVVISSDLVLGDDVSLVVPLSHPRILWDSILRRDGVVITPSTEQAGFAGANVADSLTWDFWRPTTLSATLEIEITASEECDYALIAAHTLGTAECTVRFDYHDGTDWAVWSEEVSPGNNKVLAFLNETVTASRFRLLLSTSAFPIIIPSIGIVQIGKALAMERGVTLNHRPITMQRKSVVRPQLAERGAVLGRSILRQGVQSEIEFQQLRDWWLRANFDPFIEAARVYPFGWVWAPVAYPAEVAFLWLPAGAEDIHPEHAGLQDRLQVRFNVEGIVE